MNWTTKTKEFCQEYQADIPNVVGLDTELFMWGKKWNNLPQNIEPPSTIKDTLQCVDKQAYPNVLHHSSNTCNSTWYCRTEVSMEYETDASC